MLTLDPTPPAANVIAAHTALTIDAPYVRNAVVLAQQRERASETLQDLANNHPSSMELAHAVFWAVEALNERIRTRTEAIRNRGGLLHYGAPGVAA